MTRLPRDFWSVNEDEPGPGGVLIALIVVIGILALLFLGIWLGAPEGAGFPS